MQAQEGLFGVPGPLVHVVQPQGQVGQLEVLGGEVVPQRGQPGKSEGRSRRGRKDSFLDSNLLSGVLTTSGSTSAGEPHASCLAKARDLLTAVAMARAATSRGRKSGLRLSRRLDKRSEAEAIITPFRQQDRKNAQRKTLLLRKTQSSCFRTGRDAAAHG